MRPTSRVTSSGAGSTRIFSTGSASPRKALGRVHGHAVRFGALPATGATLLAGEGIETVLSLVAPVPVPVLSAAAALSAGSLTAFVLPPGTARLLIAADRAAAGRRAAATLEARALARGIGRRRPHPRAWQLQRRPRRPRPAGADRAARPAPRPRTVSGPRTTPRARNGARQVP